MRTIRTKVYKFNELSKDAQKTALDMLRRYTNFSTSSREIQLIYLDIHEFTSNGKMI